MPEDQNKWFRRADSYSHADIERVSSRAREAQQALLAAALDQCELIARVPNIDVEQERQHVSRWVEGLDDRDRSSFFDLLIERAGSGNQVARPLMSKVVTPLLIQWLASPDPGHAAIAKEAIWSALDGNDEIVLESLASSPEVFSELKVRARSEPRKAVHGYDELRTALADALGRVNAANVSLLQEKMAKRGYVVTADDLTDAFKNFDRLTNRALVVRKADAAFRESVSYDCPGTDVTLPAVRILVMALRVPTLREQVPDLASVFRRIVRNTQYGSELRNLAIGGLGLRPGEDLASTKRTISYLSRFVREADQEAIAALTLIGFTGDPTVKDLVVDAIDQISTRVGPRFGPDLGH